MKMKWLVVVLLLFSCQHLKAVNVTITGNFPGAEGREIRLLKPMDYFTYRMEEIDAAVIGDGGNFSFELNVQSPRSVSLQVDFGRGSFFVEPGMDYQVNFEPFDFETPPRTTFYILDDTFEMHVRAVDEPDVLNENFQLLEQLSYEFIRDHVAENFRGNHRPALMQFRQDADSIFSGVQHPFFHQYYEYYFAYLYFTLNTHRTEQLLEDYFTDRTIHYENPNYAQLFSRIFYAHIQGGRSPVSQYDLLVCINRHQSYLALMDTLGKDPLLLNERLRELVLLLELQKLFDNRDFHPENLTMVLEQAAEHSRVAAHRELARNIIWQRTRLLNGYPAPPLGLQNADGTTTNLEDFRGKYLVLFFLTTWCHTCMGDLGPLADMAEEFKEQVQFVGIIADRNPEVARAMASDAAFPFRLYYFEQDFRLLERYRVSTIPNYLVIDPEGNIAIIQLPGPGSGASDRLRRLLSGR
jgi:peroxiredoxin